MRGGSGFFQHGHTYMGHPVAARGGLAVQRAILERDLLPQVRDRATSSMRRLPSASASTPTSATSAAAACSAASSSSPTAKPSTPFDPAQRIAGRLKKAAFEAGLICYPMGGTVDGRAGDHVLLAPPFIVEDKHIDEITAKLAGAIDQVL